MGKNLGEVINNIMEENSSKNVLIITEHLHIVGTIYGYAEKCPNCHECLISLKDVRISRINELSRCGDDECACHEAFAQYKWFNINTSSIVGFSILNPDNM